MATTELYNGDVRLKFDRRGHVYTVNGRKAPNVTGVTGMIAKPALIGWAAKVTADYVRANLKPNTKYTRVQINEIAEAAKKARYTITKKATDIGSSAHDWVEAHIKAKLNKTEDPEMPEHPRVRNAVEAFLAWEEEHSVQYYYAERKVYSVIHGYSGTVDIVCDVDGKLTVVDIKTSKAIYEEYFLQAAAYAKALEEELEIEFDDIAILRIPKDGAEVEYSVTGKVNEHFEVFKAALALWRWQNE